SSRRGGEPSSAPHERGKTAWPARQGRDVKARMVVFEWVLGILLASVLLSTLATQIKVPYPALLALGPWRGGAGLRRRARARRPPVDATKYFYHKALPAPNPRTRDEATPSQLLEACARLSGVALTS